MRRSRPEHGCYAIAQDAVERRHVIHRCWPEQKSRRAYLDHDFASVGRRASGEHPLCLKSARTSNACNRDHRRRAPMTGSVRRRDVPVGKGSGLAGLRRSTAWFAPAALTDAMGVWLNDGGASAERPWHPGHSLGWPSLFVPRELRQHLDDRAEHHRQRRCRCGPGHPPTCSLRIFSLDRVIVLGRRQRRLRHRECG